MISDKAIVHPNAKIHASVEIGPFTIVGEHVEIDANTVIGSHTVINGPTKIGKNNRVYQFSSIGEESQDVKSLGGKSELVIGDNNTFREFTTIHRGTEEAGIVTTIGNDNFFMAYTHVAHDCHVGNHCVFSNNATLGGHVTVRDHVIMAGFSAIHQFCEVGTHSFIAKASMVTKDVLPYLMIDGSPPSSCGLNLVGLKRRAFSDDLIKVLKQVYKVIFRQGLTTQQALAELHSLCTEHPEVALMCAGIESSTRGIVR